MFTARPLTETTLAVALAATFLTGTLTACSSPQSPAIDVSPSTPTAIEFSGDPEQFSVSSTDIDAQGMLDVSLQGRTDVTCFGDGESMQVSWSEPPAGTVALALTFENLSIPVVYWAKTNIDPSQNGIEHNRAQASSGRELTNDIGLRYPIAPCPDNVVPETYRLTVWALDTELTDNVQTYVDLREIAPEHALAVATLDAQALGAGKG